MKDTPEKDLADPRPVVEDPGPSTSNDFTLMGPPLMETNSPVTASPAREGKDVPSVSRSNSALHDAEIEATTGIPGPLEDLTFPKPVKNLPGDARSQNRPVSAAPSGKVRVSLNLPSMAASQLEHHASVASSILSRLGLLNMQIGQSTPVSLSPSSSSSVPSSSKSSPSKVEKKRKPRTQPVAASTSKVPVPPEHHPIAGGINGDASAMVVVQHLLNHIAQQRHDGKSPSLPGSSPADLQQLQPNVVASTSQPIPLPSHPSTTLATPTGPFPFSSMTKVAYTLKSTLASSHATTSSTVTTVEAVRDSSSLTTTPSTPAQKAKTSHQRNIALTSPLLVNLLQGNELPAPLTVPPLKKTKRKKPEKSPVPQPVSPGSNNLILPVKKPPRQRKKKKLDEDLNGSSLPAPVPPAPSLIFRPPSLDKTAKTIPLKTQSEWAGNTPVTSATYMVFAISTPGSTSTRSSSSTITWSMPGSLPVDMGGNVVTTPVLVNSGDGIGLKGKVDATQLLTPPGNGRKAPKLVVIRPPQAKESGGTPNADNSTSSLDSGISLGITTDDHMKGRAPGSLSLVPESSLELKVGPESECPS